MGCAQGQQCLSGVCAGLGDLSVSLQWDTVHDLDLKVKAPNGTEILYSASGPFPAIGNGELDIDSHAGCRDTDEPGVENIFWPTGQAPDGEYIIYVSNWSNCEYQPERLTCSSAFLCE